MKKYSYKFKDYFYVTSLPRYGFLFALPLFILYEILALILYSEGTGGVRNGADVFFRWIFSSMGINPELGIAIMILAIFILVFLKDNRKNVQIRKNYLVLMLAESIILSFIMAWILVRISLKWGSGIRGFWTEVMLSLGAGLFEELLFRVILLSIFLWIAGKPSWNKGHNVVSKAIAILTGAFIFSIAHYIGPMGDSFSFSSFWARFAAGVLLSFIYIFRGFGIAAWTHSLYDLWITLGIL